jgi:large subunit ribosomal protein L23
VRLSNVIEQPIITEKSVKLTEADRYVFRVNKKSSKGAVASAVKTMFDVDVVDVNTMIMPGKRRRVRGTRKYIKTKSWKKAVVTIKAGQKIEMFASLISGENK